MHPENDELKKWLEKKRHTISPQEELIMKNFKKVFINVAILLFIIAAIELCIFRRFSIPTWICFTVVFAEVCIAIFAVVLVTGKKHYASAIKTEDVPVEIQTPVTEKIQKVKKVRTKVVQINPFLFFRSLKLKRI